MRVYGECRLCKKNFEKVHLAPGIYKCNFVEVSEPVIKRGKIKHSITRIEILNGVCEDCKKIVQDAEAGSYRPKRKGGV